MTNILWFCVYASMYLWLRSKYKTFINGRLIFTKSCIPILLLNYKNVFLPHFCLVSVKVEAFKHIWESTARFLYFLKKNFSLSLKNYSFQWHEILDTNLDNLISDIGHINLRCFEVDILIPWHLSRSHDTNIRIRIFFSLGP